MLLKDAPVQASTIRSGFRIALLLAASVPAAEAALLDAIRNRDLGAETSDMLISTTIEAAIARSVTYRGDTALLLPFELEQVLRLPQILRHCFVLFPCHVAQTSSYHMHNT